jgi:hypothetical protein
MGSAIPTVPYGSLDQRPLGDSHIAQSAVIKLRQITDSFLHLALATPVNPETGNQIPEPPRHPANGTGRGRGPELEKTNIGEGHPGVSGRLFNVGCCRTG